MEHSGEILVVMEVVVVPDDMANVFQTAEEEIQGISEALHELGATVLERSRVCDCSVRRGDNQAALTDRPQVGLQSPREELAERGVLVELQLRLRPVTAGGGGEHPQDDELERLGELSGGQPAPASGEKSQREERVEQQGQRGLGWGRPPILPGLAQTARLLGSLAPGYQEAEEDESGGGENDTNLNLPVRMEQKHEGQQDQRDGEGGECQVNNPLLYFHHFLFRFSGRVGDFMGYLDPIIELFMI